MKQTKSILPIEQIQSRIFVIRGFNVILSSDLAQLYGVEAKVLNQAVKRTGDRFTPDFMFQLTQEEFESLKSQIVTSSWGGPRRALPYAFTEQWHFDALECPSQPSRNSGEHRDNASVRQYARNGAL